MTDPLYPEGEYTESDVPGEPIPEPPLVEGEYTDSELPADAVLPKEEVGLVDGRGDIDRDDRDDDVDLDDPDFQRGSPAP